MAVSDPLHRLLGSLQTSNARLDEIWGLVQPGAPRQVECIYRIVEMTSWDGNLGIYAFLSYYTTLKKSQHAGKSFFSFFFHSLLFEEKEEE